MNFDEATYADNTICCSTDAKTFNQLTQEIEEAGLRYGLKLTRHANSSQHTKWQMYISKIMRAPTVSIAPCLGNKVGIKTNNREELSNKLADCIVTMKKLDLFWRRSDCDTAIKDTQQRQR